VVDAVSVASCCAVLERRLSGYVHVRRGPNRTGFAGLSQPPSDAIRLFPREQYAPLVSNHLFYHFSHVLSVISVFVSLAFHHLC
jgi:NADH-quinone oxidoreductase subunit H